MLNGCISQRILLQVVHHLVSGFNIGLHHFAYTSAAWKMGMLSVRSQEEQWQKYPKFVFPVHQVFLALIGIFIHRNFLVGWDCLTVVSA